MVNPNEDINVPNKENVTLEDFLVCAHKGKLGIYPVTHIGNRSVVIDMDGEIFQVRYDEACVLKKEGSFLIGAMVHLYKPWDRTSR